jgi:hypothetical protein
MRIHMTSCIKKEPQILLILWLSACRGYADSGVRRIHSAAGVWSGLERKHGVAHETLEPAVVEDTRHRVVLIVLDYIFAL